MSKRSFWYQYYDDEFLNHINVSGYKPALNILMLILFLELIASDINLVTSTTYTISEFSRFCIGVSAFCYGMGVFILLKGADNV